MARHADVGENQEIQDTSKSSSVVELRAENPRLCLARPHHLKHQGVGWCRSC
jgi:hypothetical protein